MKLDLPKFFLSFLSTWSLFFPSDTTMPLAAGSAYVGTWINYSMSNSDSQWISSLLCDIFKTILIRKQVKVMCSEVL